MKDAHTGKNQTKYKDCPYVGTAITCGELILLARRISVCPKTKEKVKFGGYWSIFCGAVEAGESHYLAAHREVLEETGFNLDKEKLKHVTKVEDLRLYAYEMEDPLTPELDYEHTESGWFKIDKLHISPSPVDKKITKAIKAHHRSVT
jgi:8-oxo-dGTP pyrophosphatase MutT (NUDIX family)